MSCADPIHEVLPRLAVGELDANASQAALELVERCADCSRELDFWAALLGAAEKTPEVRRAAPLQWAAWIAGLAAAAALVLYTARDPRCKEEIETRPWKYVVLQAQKISMSGRFDYSRREGIDLAKLRGRRVPVCSFSRSGD